MTDLSSRALALAVLSLATIVAFMLLREHWGHVLGYLPYAILLACPLMHLFHGHGGHQGLGGDRKSDHAGHDGTQMKRDGT